MSVKKTKKKCFLISPIGEENSDTRVRADWLRDMIVKPVLEDQFGYEVERSDGNYLPGIIDDQIFESIENFELIIANLTEQNANVFYELGIAHSMGRPVIQMAEFGEKVPFDTSTNRVIFYGIQKPQQLGEACNELANAVKAVEDKDYLVENPFTRYRGRSAELAQATPFQKQIVELVEIFPKILSRLSRLEATLKASELNTNNVVRTALAGGFARSAVPITTVMTGGVSEGLPGVTFHSARSIAEAPLGQANMPFVDLESALLSARGVTTVPPLPLKAQDEAKDGHDD